MPAPRHSGFCCRRPLCMRLYNYRSREGGRLSLAGASRRRDSSTHARATTQRRSPHGHASCSWVMARGTSSGVLWLDRKCGFLCPGLFERTQTDSYRASEGERLPRPAPVPPRAPRLGLCAPEPLANLRPRIQQGKLPLSEAVRSVDHLELAPGQRDVGARVLAKQHVLA